MHRVEAVMLSAFLCTCLLAQVCLVTASRVRLIQGQTDRDGIVMIKENEQWSPACGVGFGKKEADVTCRHLGYDNGDAVCCKAYGAVPWTHNMPRNITCRGSESSLHSCSHHPVNRTAVTGKWWQLLREKDQPVPSITYCPNHDYAAVVCRQYPDPPEITTKLSIAGTSQFTGRLVLTYDGIEGGVCAEGWNRKAADRACKDMGFLHGANYSHLHAGYENTSLAFGPIWTSNVTCDNASSFASCQHAVFGTVKTCHHYAAVLCYNNFNHTSNGYPYYRLEGSDQSSGRVGVFIDGQWGTVSSQDMWTRHDLDVLCKSMGYSRGSFMSRILPLDSSSRTVWTVRPNCQGHEYDLMHCKVLEGWNRAASQDHTHDLQVSCYHKVKLAYGKTAHDGIVYIQLSEFQTTASQEMPDSWAPVCYDDFRSNDARVICRELGFADGMSLCCGRAYGRYFKHLNFTKRTVSITSTCNGTEGRYADCAQIIHTGDMNTCGEAKYAAVSCFSTVTPQDYLLSLAVNHHDSAYRVNSDYMYNHHFIYSEENKGLPRLPYQAWGSLTVLYNGVSGRLCPDGWTNNAARVACRELGYDHGQTYRHSRFNLYQVEREHGLALWSSNFDCTGEESRLSECGRVGWGLSQECSDESAFAGVFCYDAQGLKYRLFNPNPEATFGRVEIMLPDSNTWGTLCDSSPHAVDNDNTAQVMCRMFGYKTGFAYSVGDPLPSAVPVYERNEKCEGHEEHLEQCVHEGFIPALSSNCKDHLSDVGVFCTPYYPNELQLIKNTTTLTTTSTTPTPTPITTTTKSTTTSSSTSMTTTTKTTTSTPSSEGGITNKHSALSDSSVPSSFSSSDVAGFITGGVLALAVVVGGIIAGIVFWRKYHQSRSTPLLSEQRDPNIADDSNGMDAFISLCDVVSTTEC